MEKYLEIFKTTFTQFFIYPFSFILWRFRNLLNLTLIFFLWNSVYSRSTNVLGYTKENILAYIFVVTILYSVVFSTRTQDLAGDILNNNIINFLTKPLNFFYYLFSREIADKLLNIIFTTIEVTIFLILVRPHIELHISLWNFMIFLITLIAGLGISYYLSLTLSLFAFWTPEVWAPRFIYMILVSVFAGTFYPLDVMPKTFLNYLYLTPLPYMVFIPTKILVHGVIPNIFQIIITAYIWLVLFVFLFHFMWKKGIKEFSYYGR